MGLTQLCIANTANQLFPPNQFGAHAPMQVKCEGIERALRFEPYL